MFWDSKIRAIGRRLWHHINTPLHSGYLGLGFFGIAFIGTIALAALTGHRMMWLCAVGDGALVGLSLLEIKRKKNERQQKYRRMHGLCLGCAYDLRETPGRCPECGMIAKPICRACGRDMSDAPDECCECGAVPGHLLRRQPRSKIQTEPMNRRKTKRKLRMKHRLIKFAVRLSLILFIATVLTTAIGYVHRLTLFSVGDAYDGHLNRISAVSGLFQFQRISLVDKYQHRDVSFDFTDGWHEFGLNYHAEKLAEGGPYPSETVIGHQLIVECSAIWPFALTAILPTIKLAVLGYRRRAVKRSGHCRQCGYDLRATPDRCPECGAVPAEEINNLD